MVNTVLIVTIWDNKNIGNRLQALAMKRILTSMGYDIKYAVYNKENNVQILRRIVKGIFGFAGLSKYRKIYCNKYRRKVMRDNNKLFYPATSTIRSFNTRDHINPNDYLAAVAGSDQIWHRWSKYEQELPYFYLSFMPENKRISYAASFGFEAFPEKDLEQHKNGLNSMRFISCREDSGCKLVEQMTGKPGTLVLDPTLCVDLEYWKSIEEKPSYINDQQPYLLLFMLGKQDEYRKAVEEYAEKHNLSIVDLYDVSRIDVWRTSIGGFLWLVHCTVFSILYERPFQVFKRQQKGFENMYDRIETLLSLTKLESCHYEGKRVRKVDADYLIAKTKIETEKQKSILWLNNALNVVSNEKD